MRKREAAFRTIAQFRNNEWQFEWSDILGKVSHAERNGVRLNCIGGPLFCDFKPGVNIFGFFWRYIVWFYGVRPELKKFVKQYKAENVPPYEWWESCTEKDHIDYGTWS